MFKKMILVAVAGGLAVAAYKNTRVGSYVRSEIRSIREAAEEHVAPEQEIARLRGEVKLLDDDTLKVVKQLARLQSDQADLVKRQAGLERQKEDVTLALREQERLVREAEARAKAGEQHVSVTVDGNRYSLDTAKLKLKDRVETFKGLTRELAAVRAKLDSQQRIVDKLEAQRLAVGRLKGDLETTIDELEVEYQALKLQQMESKYQTDDTRAAHVKESINALRKRLDVQKRELVLLQDGQAPGSPVVAETVDQIMAGVKEPAAPTAAATPKVPSAKP